MFNEFTKSLMRLLSKNPIIYGFAKLVPIQFGDVATAATNGKSITIGRDFWESLDDDSRVFIIAHEALHIAWDFFGRLGNRDVYKFNIAQDLVINEFLKADGFNCPVITQGITAATLPHLNYNPDEWTSEKVYQWLIDNPDKCPQKGDNILDECGVPSDLTPEEIQKLRLAVQGVIVATPHGNIPNELKQIVESTWVPEHDWQSELSRYFNTIVQEDYSLKRYNVPSLAIRGVISPTLNCPGIGTVGVIIDTSASMFELLDKVISTLRDIFAQVTVRKVIRIDADCTIAYEKETDATEFTQRKLELSGGGGTDFRPAIQRMEDYSPDVVVYITDGYGYFPSKAPSYPLVWLDTSGSSEYQYPFGGVIRCNYKI